MDLADYFQPNPPLVCPTNGYTIAEWEGFSGPGDWLVFREGSPQPIDGRRGELNPALRLPDGRLTIFGESQGVRCLAHIEVRGGLWNQTQLIDCDGAEPLPLVGGFCLWPVSRGRFCVAPIRPTQGTVIPAFITALGHSGRVIVARRRARLASPDIDDAFFFIDVEAASVHGSYETRDDLQVALEERGFELPELEPLGASLR